MTKYIIKIADMYLAHKDFTSQKNEARRFNSMSEAVMYALYKLKTDKYEIEMIEE